MPTRAPPAVETGYTTDRARVCKGVSEPIAVTIRELGGGGDVKIISWYVAAVEDRGGEEGGGGKEQFEVGWFGYEEVVQRLTFQADREVVQRAMGIVGGKLDVMNG